MWNAGSDRLLQNPPTSEESSARSSWENLDTETIDRIDIVECTFKTPAKISLKSDQPSSPPSSPSLTTTSTYQNIGSLTDVNHNIISQSNWIENFLTTVLKDWSTLRSNFETIKTHLNRLQINLDNNKTHTKSDLQLLRNLVEDMDSKAQLLSSRLGDAPKDEDAGETSIWTELTQPQENIQEIKTWREVAQHTMDMTLVRKEEVALLQVLVDQHQVMSSQTANDTQVLQQQFSTIHGGLKRLGDKLQDVVGKLSTRLIQLELSSRAPTTSSQGASSLNIQSLTNWIDLLSS